MTICHNLQNNFFFTSSRPLLPCILSYATWGIVDMSSLRKERCWSALQFFCNFFCDNNPLSGFLRFFLKQNSTKRDTNCFGNVKYESEC